MVPSINLKFGLPVTLFKLFHFIDKKLNCTSTSQLSQIFLLFLKVMIELTMSATTFSIMPLSITTLSIMILSIMTLSIMTLSITTLSKMTLSIIRK
jgi:hypothetical protein